MKKLIVANWKMHPVKAAEAKKIFTGIQKGASSTKGAQLVVCPPFVHLPELSKIVQGAKVRLGVQDTFHEETGAFTGQVSPQMAQNYKAKWTIVGHSERRERGESNEDIGRKVRYAIEQGMQTILCVGERERTDEGEYYRYVRDELEAVFTGLKRRDLPKLVVAYEPIWAIGKRAAEAMQAPDLLEMTLFIKKLMIERFGRKAAEQVPILYGGSVKPENAAAFVREGGVDGLLVGSASLDPKQFIEITQAAVAAG